MGWESELTQGSQTQECVIEIQQEEGGREEDEERAKER